jgi:hypothetical protein
MILKMELTWEAEVGDDDEVGGLFKRKNGNKSPGCLEAEKYKSRR